MPLRKDDPQGVNKRLHIGNDHVTIVYFDSNEPFNREWLASAVNFIYIIVRPHGNEAYVSTCRMRCTLREQ